jgi:hypothetical protein
VGEGHHQRSADWETPQPFETHIWHNGKRFQFSRLTNLHSDTLAEVDVAPQYADVRQFSFQFLDVVYSSNASRIGA